MSDKNAEV